MELQLGLSLSTRNFSGGSNPPEMMGFKQLINNDECCLFNNKKRRFEDQAFAFDNNTNNYLKPCTLPLLSWGRQPNDDDDKRQNKKLPCPLSKDDEDILEEHDRVVGWPPIKSWRKKVLHHHQHCGRVIIKRRHVVAGGGGEKEMTGGSPSTNSKYVKVKMEGVAIARKVDLKLFHCYRTLEHFLINMFANCQEAGKSDSTMNNYRVTYQNKDGDWLLAGDVPWQNFIESVERLELVKNGG